MESEKSRFFTSSNDEYLAYAIRLEERLTIRSDELEELHMEAAIDAQLTLVVQQPAYSHNASVTTKLLGAAVVESNSARVSSLNDDDDAIRTSTDSDSSIRRTAPIFGDYINPHSVCNCLSPFVPTPADRIAALLLFTNLDSNDVLVDLGCGDGRVCIAASQLTGCRSIGVDLSPLCIEMAERLAKEEAVITADRPNSDRPHQDDSVNIILGCCCEFFQADATVNPDILLAMDSPLHRLRDATVIFLYTYPTLLHALVPLLQRLSHCHQLNRLVTLTYHFDETMATLERSDSRYDLMLYSSLK